MQVEFHIKEAGAHDTIKSENVNTGCIMFARLYACQRNLYCTTSPHPTKTLGMHLHSEGSGSSPVSLEEIDAVTIETYQITRRVLSLLKDGEKTETSVHQQSHALEHVQLRNAIVSGCNRRRLESDDLKVFDWIFLVIIVVAIYKIQNHGVRI
jgi:hypothetical protein